MKLNAISCENISYSLKSLLCIEIDFFRLVYLLIEGLITQMFNCQLSFEIRSWYIMEELPYEASINQLRIAKIGAIILGIFTVIGMLTGLVFLWWMYWLITTPIWIIGFYLAGWYDHRNK